MNPIRIAVVGAGHLGRIHARLLKTLPGVELVGVVDPIEEVRNRVAAEFDTKPFPDHHGLVNNIEAAVLATTTDYHHSIGVDLLHHHVHLLVEKPVTRTAEEARELVALSKEKERVLQVGHVERFNPAWRAAEPHVRNAKYIEAARTSGYTFRSIDIGVVLDLMIHDIDLVLSAVDSELVEVHATGQTVFGPHEDVAHAHLRFANGCVANLTSSRTSYHPRRSMHVMTESGFVDIDFSGPTAKVVQPSAEVLDGRIDVNQLSADEREHIKQNLFTEVLPVRDLEIREANAILDEQRDFVACIREQREPRVSGQHGLENLALAIEIAERIQSNRSARDVYRRTAKAA